MSNNCWQVLCFAILRKLCRPRSIHPKLLAVSSGGGHWVQLLRIRPAFENCEVTFVTVHASYRSQVPDHRFYVVNDANRWDKFGLLKVACRLAWIVWNERPALWFLQVRLRDIWRFGSDGCWARGPSGSIASRTSKNFQCRDLEFGRWADLWLTQWPHLARPEGPHYAGSVL